MIPNPKLSISWIIFLLGILGYFGVSDADVVLRNHPYGYSPSTQQNNNNNNNKLRGDEESLREEERLLDQVVINALANPSEWVHLKQLFERVDDQLSRTNVNLNPSISITKNLSSSESQVTHSLKEWMPSTLWSEMSGKDGKPITSSKDLKDPKPKFSYHRVIEGTRKGRPFTAVTLMDTQNIQTIPSGSQVSEDDQPNISSSRIEDKDRYSWDKMRLGHPKDHHHHQFQLKYPQQPYEVYGDDLKEDREEQHEARHHEHYHRNHRSHHHKRNDGHHHTHRNNHHHHQH